jgi:hypothetical protein
MKFAPENGKGLPAPNDRSSLDFVADLFIDATRPVALASAI